MPFEHIFVEWPVFISLFFINISTLKRYEHFENIAVSTTLKNFDRHNFKLKVTMAGENDGQKGIKRFLSTKFT